MATAAIPPSPRNCSPSASITCAAATVRRSCASPCRACAVTPGPDNQKGYRTDAEIAADIARDPLPKLKAHLVPALMSDEEWSALEAEVARDVKAGLDAARARPNPDPSKVQRFVYEEPVTEGDVEAFGGLSRDETSHARRHD